MKNLILTFLLVLASTLAFSQDETSLRYIDGDWVTEVNPNSHDELQVRTTGPYKAYNRLTGEYFVWSPVDSIWQCAYCDQTVQAQGVDGLFIKHPNGIIEYTGETSGDTATLDGTLYTSVDSAALFALDPSVDDYTVVVTSLVTDMRLLFYQDTFNQDISSWDVSNVTVMNSMFKDNISFNQDIGFWGVSKVSFMASVFQGATAFNQDLSTWCVKLIPAEPFNFDTGATSWVLDKPIWGTCP